MSVLFTSSDWAWEHWLEVIERLAPQRTVKVHGVHPYEPEEIRYALTWKPPEGLLRALPNLEVIFNLGAGVDGLIGDGGLPEGVPIVRLVDDDLTFRMGEWVALQVLTHHRKALAFLDRQRARTWQPLRQPIASEIRVGMMGVGVLGGHAARVLKTIGYRVHGWSRTPKPDAPFEVLAGRQALPDFLARTDVLVCLLPLTPETRGMLDARLIDGLATDGPLGGPVLINAGRGGVQVAQDIDAALRDGRLAGASLDVFEPEPLPADSPLWDAPNLVITPHVSAVSSPEAVVPYVLARMEDYEAGRGLANVVDRARGY